MAPRSRPLRAAVASLSTAAALLAVACRIDTAPTPSPARSRFGAYGTEPAPYDGRVRSSVYVPMPDGTRLAVDTYLPSNNGVVASVPLPVVLHYTRYVRATEAEDGTPSTTLDRDPVLQHLSRHGYAIAVADARGTGASFGTNNLAFSDEENADSRTLIEWLAAQPWSSGKVGMQGRSYPGMTQYQAAAQRPAALKAIFAEMAGPTAFDFVSTNGTFKRDFIEQWGRLTREMDLSVAATPARVDDDQGGALRDQAVAGHAGNRWAHDLLANPNSRRRDWVGAAGASGARWTWNSVATLDDTAALAASGVAIYHLVGWYDIYTTQQPLLYSNLLGKVPQKMMIGPWVHGGGYGGVVHKAEILRWYDHWLKGIDNGIMDEEPVHFFVMTGSNTLPADPGATISADAAAAEDGARWQASRQWPPAGALRQRFSFDAGPAQPVASHNDGVLALPDAPPTAAGTDTYRVDYSHAVGSFSRWMDGYGGTRAAPAGTSFFDERNEQDRKALTWTSPPLAEDLVVVGDPVVHLLVSSTHTDGDVFVFLEEIDQDGRAHYVSEGGIRAAHRALGEAPWNNQGLPFHRSHAADPRPLVPGEPAELVFSLEGTGIVFDAGHRVRVTLAGAERANYQLYPDPDGDDAPTLTVHRGGASGSYVELPVIERAAATAPSP